METRKTVRKEVELVTIKKELHEYDTPSMVHSSDESGFSIKEEPNMNEEIPAQEHFIEISTNSVSKTDQFISDKGKTKALTKDETRTLLDLILLHPIITSKETSATNNQQKIIEWNQITEDFNATCSVHPRTPKQLRLKWENLKKNARRRNAKTRLNRGKDLTEYVPRDGILERVCKLLRQRSSSLKTSKPSPKDAVVDDSDDSDGEALVTNPVKKTLTPFNTVANEEDPELPCPSDAPNTNMELNHKITNGCAGLQPKKKKFRPDEGREDRNRAITEYYKAKTRFLEANMVNAHLQKEKLKLEVELLKRKLQ